jgi:hypothetical protein
VPDQQKLPPESQLAETKAAILLKMRNDTISDWQRLTELYAEMGDEELLILDDGLGDLTEIAQQVLRDEMRKRGLSRPPAPIIKSNFSERPAVSQWNGLPVDNNEPEIDGVPYEFTWKTPLCECDGQEKANQIREALKEAGIESWIEGPGYRITLDISNPRILVAADQLEQARNVIASPIPQAIIERSNMEVPDFEPPVCPKCGAEDPLLESVDPLNTWLCEICGEQWTDPAPE